MICECGCGLPAAIAKRTNSSRGQVKGQPCRFRYGHKAASVTASDYKKVRTDRGPVRAHIVVAERALGKSLPKGAEVHHIDENKRNNANANLVICQNHAYHHLLHVRTRIVKAGGDPNSDKVCCLCRRPRPLTEFRAQTSQGTLGTHARCIPCDRAYQRQRYLLTKEATA